MLIVIPCSAAEGKWGADVSEWLLRLFLAAGCHRLWGQGRRWKQAHDETRQDPLLPWNLPGLAI